MRVSFRSSFARDLGRIKDRSILRRIRGVIEEVERVQSLREITGVRKISGTRDLFRMRVGLYRVGVVVTDDGVDFVRCLHRREIYRYFG